MADFSSLITTIRASINANGRGAITGNLLQAQLVAIINAINTAKEDTGDYPTTTQMSSAISTALSPYIKTTEVQTLLSQTLASYSTSSQMAQAIAAAIAPLATDSAVVHKTGAETIAGNKTFTGKVSVEGVDVKAKLSTLETAVGTKATDTAVVHKTGAESISGEKSFNGQVNMLGGANVTGDFTADFSKIIDINTGENVAQLSSEIGDLSDLETTDKSSLVNAINEARQSGGGGGSTTIVDNLTSDSTTSALSAKQGKVLKGLVDGKQATISDLSTIRSGASLGATSVQNVYSLLCGDYEVELNGTGTLRFPLINGQCLFNNANNDILGVTIDDNLTSTETNHALSAKQGKVLKGLVDAKANDSAVVHKSGNETISGEKTFSDAVSFTNDVFVRNCLSLRHEDTGYEVYLELEQRGDDVGINLYGDTNVFLVGLRTPVGDTEATNKSYVDTAVSAKADKITSANSGTAFDANKIYKLGTISGTQSFSLNASSEAYAEYMIEFSTGDTAPSITWNMPNIKWMGGTAPTINANKSYYVSILDNLAVCGEF